MAVRKKNINKIESIENRCLNAGNIAYFNKAIEHANEQDLKYGSLYFLGTIRRLVELQEAGMVVMG